MKQSNMFESQDLPLFSGTPQAGKDPEFTPKAEPIQGKLINCKWCNDTGWLEYSMVENGKSISDNRVACTFTGCTAGKDKSK